MSWAELHVVNRSGAVALGMKPKNGASAMSLLRRCDARTERAHGCLGASVT